MKYGIAITPVVPMRAAADERSEMTSQLLWGETFCVEEQSGCWLRVCAAADSYVGWVNPLMVRLPDEEAWGQYAAQPSQICTSSLCFAVDERAEQRVCLPQGSLLYGYSEATRTFMLAGRAYRLERSLRKLPRGRREASVAAALQLLNAPYLWGGRTLLGIDCSGLTQLAYRVAGVSIPRDAAQQAGVGSTVAAVERAQPADLAFFCGENERITHVGMLLGEGRIVHASGSVRIDKVDSRGIFNSDLNRYTHRLKVVKNLQPEVKVTPPDAVS
ncbi:MAG: C40 family peptidase [Prevotellaceae bacterium]|jgi:cell wall-associated NlpC family hydrolase|nr:C40 family peptidase [Prevotellaceae bacterium]